MLPSWWVVFVSRLAALLGLVSIQG